MDVEKSADINGNQFNISTQSDVTYFAQINKELYATQLFTRVAVANLILFVIFILAFRSYINLTEVESCERFNITTAANYLHCDLINLYSREILTTHFPFINFFGNSFRNPYCDIYLTTESVRYKAVDEIVLVPPVVKNLVFIPKCCAIVNFSKLRSPFTWFFISFVMDVTGTLFMVTGAMYLVTCYHKVVISLMKRYSALTAISALFLFLLYILA